MKERLVTCNEEDTDGRARVTRDEERVHMLHNMMSRANKPFSSFKRQYLEKV